MTGSRDNYVSRQRELERQLSIDTGNGGATNADAIGRDGEAKNAGTTKDSPLGSSVFAPELDGLSGVTDERSDAAIAATTDRVFYDANGGGEGTDFDSCGRALGIPTEENNSCRLVLNVQRFHASEIRSI